MVRESKIIALPCALRGRFGKDGELYDRQLIQITLNMDKQTTGTRESGGLKKDAGLLKCENLTLLSLSESGILV